MTNKDLATAHLVRQSIMWERAAEPGSDAYTLLEWVDAIADRFERSWNTGETPRISDYLVDTVGEKRTTLARELAKIDLERRVRAGEDRKWDDYVREFPELEEAGEDVIVSVQRLTLLDEIEPGRVRGRLARSGKWPAIEGYDVLAELGHGGMGSVYKARQRSLKRIVALKVIRPGAQSDSRYLARFQTEAEAAARLQHANIAQIYEVGHQDGVPYIAMEYVGGGSLAERQAGKPQPPRQAAQLVAALARAMQYAHEQGVVHRDLKPDNVLLQNGATVRAPITDDGRPPNSLNGSPPRLARGIDFAVPKITDFGLAKLVEGESGQTVSGAIMGTPSYMAPEQAEGKARAVGPPADIYALGAILYELITGGPPFKGACILETLEQVRIAEPMPPSRLLKVPRDLETICLKALSRAPGSRYATAGVLADDLSRFLERKPIQARPVSAAERVWRWCRRRPALAGLIATTSALLLTVVAASLLVALASIDQEKSRRREGLMQQLQLVRANAHLDGWSDEAWRLASEAASLRQDTALRTLAASCTGLDARILKRLEKASVSWAAFDSSGRRLLLGGRNDGRGHALEGAKVWDLDSGRLVVSRNAGPGPVTFGSDGNPVHLSVADDGHAAIWNVLKQQPVTVARLATESRGPVVLEHNELGLPVLALSENATVAAAVISAGVEQGCVAVWDAQSGRLLFRSNQRSGALALSPKGGLLASADLDGHIALWTIPEGKQTANFDMSRVTIHSLVFSSDGNRLAVGDSAGAVTVWDRRTRLPVTNCQGSHEDVYAIAFTPDGTLIASGGRGPVRIWDAATGRLVLSLRTPSVTTALAFSPDGRRLVVGSKAPALAVVWELHSGIGTQILRGLTSQASRVCFSRDGKLVAALGHNWQVGIWEVRTGLLKYTLAAPRGNADDDSAFAFDATGSRFACSAGQGAKLWDMATGRELGAWRLPAGAKDALAFHPSGALLSFRREEEPAAPGVSADVRQSGSAVCRIRNLLGPTPVVPLVNIEEFNRHLLDTLVTPDGEAFIAEGVHQDSNGQRRSVRAFDSLTGGERWALSSTRSRLEKSICIDPSGMVLALQADNRDDVGSLADAKSGKLLDELHPVPICLGVNAHDLVRFGAGNLSGEARGYALFQPGDSAPRLVLGVDTSAAFRPVFSRDGHHLAWSNSDGTVSVCDLPLLRGRLSEIGLAW
jgi:serine/threonine protein kinase/WD40 repeat protein